MYTFPEISPCLTNVVQKYALESTALNHCLIEDRAVSAVNPYRTGLNRTAWMQNGAKKALASVEERLTV